MTIPDHIGTNFADIIIGKIIKANILNSDVIQIYKKLYIFVKVFYLYMIYWTFIYLHNI